MEQKKVHRSVLGLSRKLAFLICGLLFGSSAFFVFALDEKANANIVEDSDQDGLTNAEEQLYGTDATNPDTDGDGYTDGVEVRSGYNPMKKAPGDKITTDSAQTATEDGRQVGENLTQQMSSKIAGIVQNAEVKDDGTASVSLDELNSLSEEIAAGGQDNIVLPDVDVSTIKTKKESYTKLSDKDRKEKVKEDITEYMTVIAYIFANNSPQTVKTTNDLQSVSDTVVKNATSALTVGNLSQIDALAENGNKILEQVKDVEVPETMLDTHVKALKLAMYASELHDKAPATTDEDPIQSIKTLSYTQGLLNVASSFAIDVQKKLADEGISEIPIEF
ncbi:MAG: hypothetical protein HGA31_01230 [Candidatus Moranbacteria bacterium]|nr:hypothetical protein [Candidatus Moranbacteria bacterium]